ncbi:MAG: FtsQ-type POTRA domain-containing protein [Candidatus Eisenbacteria bacterium]
MTVGAKRGRGCGRPRRVYGAAVLVAVAALAFGIERGHRWLLAEGRFPVTEIRVSGSNLLYEGEVVQAAGVERGTNLLTVDAGEVEARLLASGWIRAARVRRRPPGRVLVQIEERRPWLLRPGEPAAFVDREGHTFPAMGKEERLDLPILADRSGKARPIVARLASAFPPEEKWFGGSVLQVSIDANGSVTLIEARHGTRIRLGDTGFAGRAERLRLVLDEWAKSGEAFEEIDLRYEGQAIARRPIPLPGEEGDEDPDKREEGERGRKSV